MNKPRSACSGMLSGFAAGREAPALWLVAIACYGPLYGLADLQAARSRLAGAMAALLTQQVREVLPSGSSATGSPG